MSYRLINQKTLQWVYDEYVRFRNARIDIINYIRDKKLKEWKAEAESDIRTGRYNTPSVQRWYDGKIDEMNKWLNDCQRELNRCDREFDEMMAKIRAKKFTNYDLGTRTVFNFYTNEVIVEKGATSDKYYVNFHGYNWSYSWKPIPETKVEFKPGNAPSGWFTDLID